jgi:tetratricopeptide (TPR) repeat protein
MKRSIIVVLFLAVFLSLAFSLLAARSGPPSSAIPVSDQISSSPLSQARTELQKGFHLWDPEIMKSARDRFLALLLTETPPTPGLAYEMAIADYRLGNYYLAAGNKDEAERYVSEAQKYAAQAGEEDPKRGETDALEAYLFGMELALHPDRAMALFPRSAASFSAALTKSPENPRVFLLKALSVYYTPEAFEGGPLNAQGFLEKSLALADSSWGREEAYAYLGLCHKKRGDTAKAREMLKKALASCPNFSFAAHELQVLGDK